MSKTNHTPKYKLAFILGIRPDVIRAALILKYLEQFKDIETTFIWSGQHYSDNLKDIFFRELTVRKPDIDLGASGETDAETVGKGIAQLYVELEKLRPDVAVFLGDTNTVVSCLAAAQLNIPIVHIEGGMRSYDWRMPEEKYRTTIDHLADVIYAYFDEYKQQAIREGIHPDSIEVVTNPIVDILEFYYFKNKPAFDAMATPAFFAERNVEKGEYYVMTCHRRENVHHRSSLENILQLVAAVKKPVYFPASYRTQKVIKEEKLSLPTNLIMVDPIGYQELLVLMVNSRGVLTDSGTVVEECCVLGVPSVQMRRSTERPQVYDVGSSVKFDPQDLAHNSYEVVVKKLEKLWGKTWKHPFGDGKASERIALDLHKRLVDGTIRGHRVENHHLPIERSYRHDGL